MSQHFFIACDGCKNEIKEGEEFVTRCEYVKPFDSLNNVGELPKLARRDLCQTCNLRVKQAIIASGLDIDWLLNGFERGRHDA